MFWTHRQKYDRFVYQVVVPKALAPRDLVQVYEADEKIVLPPWDPLVRHAPWPFSSFASNIKFQGCIGMIFFQDLNSRTGE